MKASELTTIAGRALGRTTAATAAMLALAGSPALAGPQGEQVVFGSASFSRNGNSTVIETSNTAIINYYSFNIGANESVQFIQPSVFSKVLNRIESAMPTTIDGKLTSNGRLYFVNPAGIFFGHGSVVDVGGLYAAAGNMSDSDFLAGINRFSGLSGEVVNHGTLKGGEVHLLGAKVSNFGQVLADDVVTMTAGDEVLIGHRDGHVFAKITGSATPNLQNPTIGVENAGEVVATRQAVLGVGDHFALALYDTSAIFANRVDIEGGDDSQVAVSGQIGAHGHVGGDININGEYVSLENALVDASGVMGGGTVNIGGEFQGQGDKNATVTTVDAQSTVRADAWQYGKGGTVILWSDVITGFHGELSAQGGALGGDGGFAEISGKQVLQMTGGVNLKAEYGRTGTLLLDPTNIRVTTAASASDTANPLDLVFGAADIAGMESSITMANLTTLLSGASVILQADNDIAFDAGTTVMGGAGNSLILTAGGGVSLDAGTQIMLNNGSFVAEVDNAGGLAGGTGGFMMGAGSSIITGGGSVQITSGGAFNSGDFVLGHINAGSGSIILNASAPAAGAVNVLSNGDANAALIGNTVSIDIASAGGGLGADGAALNIDAANFIAQADGNVFLNFDSTIDAAGATGGMSTVNMLTTTGDVTITSGDTLALNTGITAGTNISLSVADLIVSGAVSATNITIAGGGGVLDLGTNGGTGLGLNANELDFLLATGTLTFGDATTTDINISNIGMSLSDRDVELSSTDTIDFLGSSSAHTFGSLNATSGGEMTIAESITTLTGEMSLDAGASTISVGGAGDIALSSAAALTLSSDLSLTGTNLVSLVGNGAISLRNITSTGDGVSALTINSNGGDIDLDNVGAEGNALGQLNIDAGAGALMLDGQGYFANGMDFDAGSITISGVVARGAGNTDIIFQANTGDLDFSGGGDIALAAGFDLIFEAWAGSVLLPNITAAAAGADLDIVAAVTASLMGVGSAGFEFDDIYIQANEIDLGGMLLGTAGSTLQLTAFDGATGIRIGAADNASGEVDLTAAELAMIGNGFDLITFGADTLREQDNTDDLQYAGAISVDSASAFADSVTLLTRGAVTIDGTLETTTAGDSLIIGDGAFSPSAVNLNVAGVSLRNNGGLIDIFGNITLGADTEIEVTNAGTIRLRGTVDGTTEGQETLALDGGDDGTIDVQMGIGTNVALESLDIDGNNITLASIGTNAADGVAGETDIDARGLVTFNGADYRGGSFNLLADGGYVINQGTTFNATFNSLNDDLLRINGGAFDMNGFALNLLTQFGDINVGSMIAGNNNAAEILTITAGQSNANAASVTLADVGTDASRVQAIELTADNLAIGNAFTTGRMNLDVATMITLNGDTYTAGTDIFMGDSDDAMLTSVVLTQALTTLTGEGAGSRIVLGNLSGAGLGFTANTLNGGTIFLGNIAADGSELGQVTVNAGSTGTIDFAGLGYFANGQSYTAATYNFTPGAAPPIAVGANTISFLSNEGDIIFNGGNINLAANHNLDVRALNLDGLGNDGNVTLANLISLDGGATRPDLTVVAFDTATLNGIGTAGVAFDNVTIQAAEIQLEGDVFGTGILTLSGFLSATNINIGNNAETGDLDLNDDELARLQNGFSQIFIGTNASVGDFVVDGATFSDALTLLTAGTVTINDTLATTDADAHISIGENGDNVGQIVMNSAAATITTMGGNVDLFGDVLLQMNSEVTTMGGNLSFFETLDGAFDFTATTGAGDIIFDAAGGADIGTMAALASLTLNGNNITLQNIGNGMAGVTGLTDIDAAGLLTLDGATYRGGTFDINAAGGAVLNDQDTSFFTDGAAVDADAILVNGGNWNLNGNSLSLETQFGDIRYNVNILGNGAGGENLTATVGTMNGNSAFILFQDLGAAGMELSSIMTTSENMDVGNAFTTQAGGGTGDIEFSILNGGTLTLSGTTYSAGGSIQMAQDMMASIDISNLAGMELDIFSSGAGEFITLGNIVNGANVTLDVDTVNGDVFLRDIGADDNFLAGIDVNAGNGQITFTGTAYNGNGQSYTASQYNFDPATMPPPFALTDNFVFTFTANEGDIVFAPGLIVLGDNVDLALNALDLNNSNDDGNITLTDIITNGMDSDLLVTAAGTAIFQSIGNGGASGFDDIVVRANEANFFGMIFGGGNDNDAGDADGLEGSNFMLSAFDDNRRIVIGSVDAAMDGDIAGSDLDFTDFEISMLQEGFDLITFGRDTSTGSVLVDASGAEFIDSVQLLTTGNYVVLGQLFVNDAANNDSITIGRMGLANTGIFLRVDGDLNDDFIYDNAALLTTGGDINLFGAVTLERDTFIDTGAGGGNVTIIGGIDTDGAGANESLLINAGAGNISHNGGVGLNNALEFLTLLGNDVTLTDIGTMATAGVNETVRVEATGLVSFFGNDYHAGAFDLFAAGGYQLNADARFEADDMIDVVTPSLAGFMAPMSTTAILFEGGDINMNAFSLSLLTDTGDIRLGTFDAMGNLLDAVHVVGNNVSTELFSAIGGTANGNMADIFLSDLGVRNGGELSQIFVQGRNISVGNAFTDNGFGGFGVASGDQTYDALDSITLRGTQYESDLFNSFNTITFMTPLLRGVDPLGVSIESQQIVFDGRGMDFLFEAPSINLVGGAPAFADPNIVFQNMPNAIVRATAGDIIIGNGLFDDSIQLVDAGMNILFEALTAGSTIDMSAIFGDGSQNVIVNANGTILWEGAGSGFGNGLNTITLIADNMMFVPNVSFGGVGNTFANEINIMTFDMTRDINVANGMPGGALDLTLAMLDTLFINDTINIGQQGGSGAINLGGYAFNNNGSTADVNLISNGAGGSVNILGDSSIVNGGDTLFDGDMVNFSADYTADTGNITTTGGGIVDGDVDVTTMGGTITIGGLMEGEGNGFDAFNLDAGNGIVDIMMGIGTDALALDNFISTARNTFIRGNIRVADQIAINGVTIVDSSGLADDIILFESVDTLFNGQLRSLVARETGVLIESSGTTTFMDTVGAGSGRLRSLQTDAGGQTIIFNDISTQFGQDYGDDVIISGTPTLRSFEDSAWGSIYFRGTVSGDGANGRSLTVLTNLTRGAPVNGMPDPEMPIINFVGDITDLDRLNLNFSGGLGINGRGGIVPVGATVIFGNIEDFLNGGATRDFTIDVDTIRFGRNEKLAVLGGLNLTADNAAFLGDISALGNILVDTGTLNILQRPDGQTFNPLTGLLESDDGVDWVASGATINIQADNINPQGNGGALQLAVPSGFALIDGVFLIRAYDRQASVFITDGQVIIDLLATGTTNADFASLIAGATPQQDETTTVSPNTAAGTAAIRELTNLGIFPKPTLLDADLSFDQRIDLLQNALEAMIGAAVYDDLPDAELIERTEVTVNRLPDSVVSRVLGEFRALLQGDRTQEIEAGETYSRAESIRNTLSLAVENYYDVLDADDFETEAFLGYLSTAENGSEAAGYVRELRDFYTEIVLLGLSEQEMQSVISALFETFRPGDLTAEEFRSLIGADNNQVSVR